MFFSIKNEFLQMVLTHLLLIVVFALVYFYLFNNIDKHYILSNEISKDNYKNNKNKIINSLYLSMVVETNTGYCEFNLKSPEAKIIGTVHMFLSLIVSIGYIVLAFKK